MGEGMGRLRELWEKTSRTNQVMLIAAVVAALVVGIGFAYWAGTPDYVTLVSNPSPQDAAGIIAQLQQKKVLYRISPDGSTIEVPASQRAELRMSLASAGLLNTGSLGYGLLDKTQFGQTQAMEQETIRRALEGEMEKSIQSLGPVASANVKFAAGEDSPFVSDKKEPSASVLVHLKAGQEVTKENTRAIVNLVAHAYPGLKSKNVSVVDGDGNLLWDGAQQDLPTASTEERQAQERAYKQDLAREIQQLCKSAVGPNKSSVIVRADLDFDKQSITKHEVLPGAVATQTSEEETLKGAGAIGGPRPPAGVAANTGGAPRGGANVQVYANGTEGGPGNYTHTETTKTVTNGASETTTVRAPGEVKSLGVSVLLDKSITPDTVAALTQTIQTYIGADPKDPANNRRVSVQTVAFDKTAIDAEKKAAESAASSDRISRILSYAVPLVLMFAMLFLLARTIKPRRLDDRLAVVSGDRRRLGPGAGGLDLAIGDSPDGMRVGEALDGQPLIVGVGADDKVHTYDVISEQFDANLESILHLAKSKPETVAALIKSWTSVEEKK